MDIAIIGVGCRFPGVNSLFELLTMLKDGKSVIRPISKKRLIDCELPHDKEYTVGGFLEDIDKFDYRFFNISLAEAETMDPHQRIILEVMYECIENAAVNVEHLSNTNTSVYMSDVNLNYYSLFKEFIPTLVTGNTPAFTASRLGRQFNLRGNMMLIDTSCSASLVAVHQACTALQVGDSNMAFVCGINLDLFPFKSNIPSLDIDSPDGNSTPFSESANGMTYGESAICIMLKPFRNAIADGNIIHGVIKGSAIGSNGNNSASLSAPDSRVLATVMERAYANANISINDIGYLEAHGSATKLGDSIEVGGIGIATNSRTIQSKIPISTIKSNVGHTRNSSGLSGLLRGLISVKEGLIFPTAGLETPNRLINFDAANVFVTSKLLSWNRNEKGTRVAGVTSIGLSGVYCHMVIESSPVREIIKSEKEGQSRLILLTATNQQSLEQNLLGLAKYLTSTDVALSDISYTLAVGRKHFDYRFSCIVNSSEELVNLINSITCNSLESVDAIPLSPKFALLLSDFLIEDEKMTAYLKYIYPFFSNAYDQCCDVRKSLSLSDDNRFRTFSFQYSYYILLLQSGVQIKSLIGFGIGKIVNKVITNEISLQEAFMQVSMYETSDSSDIPMRLKGMLEKSSDKFFLLQTHGDQLHLQRFFEGSPFNDRFFGSDFTMGDPLLNLVNFLFLKGFPVDWKKFYEHRDGRASELPSYHFDKTRVWPEAKIVIPAVQEVKAIDPEQKFVNSTALLIKTINEFMLVDIDETTDFFEAGGNSLMASKLITAINKRFNLSLDFEDLFDYPVISIFIRFVQRSLIKEKIVFYWKHVMRVKVVDRNDNFFKIGGHSLIGNQLLNKINQHFDTRLSFDDLFKNPTPGQLTELVNGHFGTQTTRKAIIEQIPDAPDYELSHAQRRLWVIDQFETSQSAYNVPAFFTLNGDFDANAFNQAINHLLTRHEDLRTVFKVIDGEPRQVIMPAIQWNFSDFFIDLSKLNDRQHRMTDIANNVANLPFNLAEGPLYRMKIVKMGSSQHILLMCIHHIVFDGWSLNVFFNDLISFYSEYRDKKSISVKPLSFQYRDFAHWQNRFIRQLDVTAATFWHSELSGDLPILEFPTDRPRPQFKTFTSKNLSLILKPETVKALDKVCSIEGVSPFVLLLTIFDVLLYKYTGQKDLIVGIPMAGRIVQELENQIGLYINTLPLRAAIDPEQSFVSMLNGVKTKFVQALEHQIYPFDLLVEELNVERDLSRSPLFDVLFVSHNFLTNREEISRSLYDLEIIPFETEFSPNKFDFSIYYTRIDDLLQFDCGYNLDLFQPETIRTLLQNFEELIQSICGKPDLAIRSFSCVGKIDREWLLFNLNNTIAPYSHNRLLHELFEEIVDRYPNHIAVSDKVATISYLTLNKRANKLAWFLMDLGVSPKENVGLIIDRSIDMIVAVLAILKCGGAYVPVEPNYPDEKRDYVFNNSDVKRVLTDRVRQSSDQIYISVADPAIETFSEVNTRSNIASHDLAYIIHTSGSTGIPKGVMIEHHSVINLVQWVNQEYSIKDTDVLLCVTSLCFDLSVYDIFGSLLAGATLVISQQEDITGIKGLIRIFKESHVTFWNSVPTTMAHVTDYLELFNSDFLNTSVRIFFLSGDWIPLTLPARIRKYFPNARVISLGGATEATVWSNYFEVNAIDDSWRSIPYGKPITNNFFYVLDEFGSLSPRGAIGELYIGGRGVARGYSNDTSKTEKSFVIDTLSPIPGMKMYKTGDLGKIRFDGNIEIMGRKDYQVKIRGYRIELGEIEYALSFFSGIKEGIVIAKMLDTTENTLICYYTSHAIIDVQELKQFLSQKLVHYMIPTFFIHLDKIPLNSNGKVDRKALNARKDNVIKREALSRQTTEMEKLLEPIWCEILGRSEIEITENFFEIGGHSIRAARLVGFITKKLGIAVELRLLFMYPTIQALAVAIENGNSKKYQPIPRAEKRDFYPLSFAQKALWISSNFGTGAEYNIPGGCIIHGPIDIERLQSAIHATISRHESIRTRFITVAGEPFQVVVPYSSDYIVIDVINVMQINNTDDYIKHTTTSDLLMPFNLKTGPLFRIKIFMLSERKTVLYFCIHHLIADGWSLEIFKRDVITSYQTNTLGDTSESINYKDFVRWETETFTDDLIEKYKKFWISELSGRLPQLTLQGSLQRPPNKTYAGRVLESTLQLDVSKAIDNFCLRNDVTLFMFLMTVSNLLLHYYSKQKDIIVGTPLGGREHPDLENQIGLYLSTVPFRTNIDEAITVEQMLLATKAKVLSIFEHAYFPWESVKKEINFVPLNDRTPLYDVIIVLQNFSGINNTQGGVPEELTVDNYCTDSSMSKYDLVFIFSLTRVGEIELSIEFNTDNFNEPFIRELQTKFSLILNEVLENPHLKLSALKELRHSEKTFSMNFKI